MQNPLRLGDAPPREGLFSPVDLLLALTLFFAGVVLYAQIAHALVPTEPGTGHLAYTSALQQAGVAALGVVMTTGLMAGYTALRAWANVEGARLGIGWRRLGLIPRRPWRDLAAAAAGLLIAVPLVIALNVAVAWITRVMGRPTPPIDHPVLAEMTRAHSRAAVAVLIFTAVALAPVFEETVYRGLVQTLLLRGLGPRRRAVVIGLAAALFAAIHVSLVSWQALPTLFALGLALGYLYERTGSLWPGIVTHAGFNVVNIAIALTLVKSPAG